MQPIECTHELLANSAIVCCVCSATARAGDTFLRCVKSRYDEKDLPIECSAYVCTSEGCQERHSYEHQKADAAREKRTAAGN